MIYKRSLAEADVYLYKVAGNGTCQIRTSLDTLYDGEVAATGVTFSVQALETSLDIQALEFAYTPGSSASKINIYARKGTSFSTTASDWITLALATTSVVSPDGLGMITPRAAMKQALTIAAGETWTIYISSSSANIKLASTTTGTGSSYQVDDFLQLNVGEGMTESAEFSASRTGNRGFQGKLYYRVLKPCKDLTTETELIFPFATASGMDRVKLNDAVTTGLNNLLTQEADLKRLTNVNGLSIKSMELKSKGSSEDCSEYNLTGACDLYDSDILFGHYKSLVEKELVLEILLKLNFRKGLGDLGNGINVTYIGDQVLQQQYDVTITGVPSGTVLNPIQRDYLQHVTLDFLDDFSESAPNRVTIQQSVHRLRHLRSRESTSGDSMSSWSRSLEAGNVVKAKALVYGIGKDSDAFFKELDKAFVSNTKQYKEEVQRQQYLPGEINDEKNFGVIFEDITEISVVRSKASETSSPTTTSSKEKLNSSQIQIIVFSVLVGLCFFWLVYRIMKDCVLVEDGWAVKKEKLSEKVEREKDSTVARPELSNMDKPRQRVSTPIDVSSLPEVKAPVDEPTVATKETIVRRGRKPETSDSRLEPSRGVRRAKSNDDDLLFGSVSGTNLTSTTHSQREPTRGVGRTRSSDDVDLFGAKGAPSASSIHDRSVASSRGVGRSKSGDLSHMVASQHKGNNDDSHSQRSRPPPATRGVKKSNTFSGAEQFLAGGSQAGTKTQNNSNGKDTTSVSKDSSKKKSGKKKRGKADGKSGAKSTKSTGGKAKKGATNLPRRVDMTGQRV